MTISSSTRKAGPFAGNGVQVAFPFAYKVFSAADVLVVQAVTATGLETVKTLTTDYSVVVNPDQTNYPGGTVNMLVPPPAGSTLTLSSQVANLQPVVLTNSGGFYPAVINDALDRVTIQIQQLAEKLGRAFGLPISSTASGVVPNPVALALLGWNSAGTALQNFTGFASVAVSTFMTNVVSAVDAATARLGLGAAASGVNNDITSLTALSGPVNGPTAIVGAAVGMPLSNVLSINGGQIAGNRNKIIGHFDINQRGLVSVGDDAYCLDRWYVLTETGNVTVAQITDPESGAPYAIRITQPDASAKRMGVATIIESKDIRAYRNTAMNFAARVKPSFAGNVRYAILEHTGTADTVTSDVVNNWASATFTAGNFFIAGLNVLKTGTVAPGAAAYGDLSDWSALGAATNNIILFVWSESTQAQNATLELNRPQYEPGVIRTAQEWRLNELALCQRCFYKQTDAWSSRWGANGVQNVIVPQSLPVTMRATPTVIAGTPTYVANSAFGNTITASREAIFWNANSSAAGDTQVSWSGYGFSADL